MSEPRFFATPEAFRKWLHANHAKKSEQWVGFWKRDSGKRSITWPESVDEALCVGWIDGLRKSIDEVSYMIRFTPRKATSNWSAVNVKRMAELIPAGRVLPAGLAAWERRSEVRNSAYSYENRHVAKFDEEMEARFRANRKAWAYFSTQPPSFIKLVTWWIISAKQAATRERRLALVIECSAAGEWPPQMKWATSARRKAQRSQD
jgi:uncharacterized protein YdeI (YjbR/CyaY-like superfamily)